METIKKRRTFRHLSWDDRDRIEALLRSGHAKVEIADVLGGDKSTITRELRRNANRRTGRYRATFAEQKTATRRRQSKYRGMKIEENPELKKHIIKMLRKRRSPDEGCM